MMNPIEIFKMMKSNPQQIAMNMIKANPQISNNPMAQNLIGMAQKGDYKGIEEFGRNIAKERGVDFDKSFEEFRNQLQLK